MITRSATTWGMWPGCIAICYQTSPSQSLTSFDGFAILGPPRSQVVSVCFSRLQWWGIILPVETRLFHPDPIQPNLGVCYGHRDVEVRNLVQRPCHGCCNGGIGEIDLDLL